MRTLLERLGCQVVPLNLEPTGVFAHTPEPVPENLGDLCRTVRESHVDFGMGLSRCQHAQLRLPTDTWHRIGIAVDPDVDRCVLIDETGNPLGEEYTLALAVDFVLGEHCGKVRQMLLRPPYCLSDSN